MRAMTRTESTMADIRERIAKGTFAPGDRLPSVRQLATQRNLSPSTIVEAYDRLAAEGVIRARPGSGFYVIGIPRVTQADASRQDRAVDPFWVSRQSLDTDLAMRKPGCGWLPADWMPQGAIRRALREISRADATLLTDYGPSQGPTQLRDFLARQFTRQGLRVTAAQILLTGSGSQAIDLVCRLLLRPGDTVLVDDPCYFNFRAMLQAHRVQVLGVPYTENGPDPEQFEAILRTEKPRLYLTNSALHNPTGATMVPVVAHRLLMLAASHDLTIIEDDIFADFEPELSVRLALLDGLKHVIRIGSFSKTLSASIRCGYIVATPALIDALTDLQVATSFSGVSPITAEIIHSVLSGGGYRKHMEEIRRRLARARREVATRLRGIEIEPWIMPRGGFYLWCRLPNGIDAAALARAALNAGLLLAPGDVFSVSGQASGFMRVNVTQMAGSEIFEQIVQCLADVRVSRHI